VAAYASERPLYQTLARVLERVLQRAVDNLGLEAIVQVRTKQPASFAEKTIRKQALYPDPLNMMTDLCGARVITESTNEIPLVCDFIRKHFETDEANSEDAAGRLGVSDFGYRSVHFSVSLKPGELQEDIDAVIRDDPVARSTLDRLFARRSAADCVGKPYGPGPRYKAEILVRSLLQHAWARIGNPSVPRLERRERYHRKSVRARLFAGPQGGAAGKARRSRRARGLGRAWISALPMRRAGASAPPGEPGGGRGYHCTCWSNKYAGSGCTRASPSGMASASLSSHGGGPRAGAIGGG